MGRDRDVLDEALRDPGLSVEELARRVERSPSAASRSVSRLTKLGYVRRVKNGRKAEVYPELKRVVRARPLKSGGDP